MLAKDAFTRTLRLVAGDEVLRSAIQEINASGWFGSVGIVWDFELLISFVYHIEKKKCNCYLTIRIGKKMLRPQKQQKSFFSFLFGTGGLFSCLFFNPQYMWAIMIQDIKKFTISVSKFVFPFFTIDFILWALYSIDLLKIAKWRRNEY